MVSSSSRLERTGKMLNSHCPPPNPALVALPLTYLLASSNSRGEIIVRLVYAVYTFLIAQLGINAKTSLFLDIYFPFSSA